MSSFIADDYPTEERTEVSVDFPLITIVTQTASVGRYIWMDGCNYCFVAYMQYYTQLYGLSEVDGGIVAETNNLCFCFN